MHLRVEEIDARTAPDEQLLAIHAIEEACAYDRPFRDPQLSLAYYRHWSDGTRRRWLARDGEEIVGFALLMVPSPTFAMADVMVRPDGRRRGTGRALYEALLSGAREEAVRSFFGHHWSPDGAGFARAMGAVDDQRDVASELRLRETELPEPSLPAGWRLVTWYGAAPEELVDSFAVARSAMDDAPAPGGLDYGPIDAAAVRAIEQTARERGREVRVTAAVDDHGVVGAFTDVRVSAPPSPIAGTDDTATIPSARGQGLATAVKLESLRRLRDERPDVEVVRTMNAEQNAAMRAVNTRLGFVPTAVLTSTVVTLAPPAA
jgi:GNAT superfamily N-acetyltransferase